MKKICSILSAVFFLSLFFCAVHADEIDFKSISGNYEKLTENVKKGRKAFIEKMFSSLDKESFQVMEPVIRHTGTAMENLGYKQEWTEFLFENRKKLMKSDYLALLVMEAGIYFSKEMTQTLTEDLIEVSTRDVNAGHVALLYAIRLYLNADMVEKAGKLINNNRSLLQKVPMHILVREMAIYYKKTDQPEKAMLELDKAIKDYEARWKKMRSELKAYKEEREAMQNEGNMLAEDSEKDKALPEDKIKPENGKISESDQGPKDDGDKKKINDKDVKLVESYVVDSKLLKAQIAFETGKYNTCINEASELLRNHKEKLSAAAALKLNSLYNTGQYDRILLDYRELITYFKSFDDRVRIFTPYARTLMHKEDYLEILSQVRKIGSYDEYTSNREVLLILFSAAFRENLEARTNEYFLRLGNFNVEDNPEYMYTKCRLSRKQKNYRVWFKNLSKLEGLDKKFYNREIVYNYNARFYYNMAACRWHRAIDWAVKSLKAVPDQPELSGIAGFMAALLGRKETGLDFKARFKASELLNISFFIHRQEYGKALEKLKALLAGLDSSKNGHAELSSALKKSILICTFMSSDHSAKEAAEFMEQNSFDDFEKLFLIDKLFYKAPEITKKMFQKYLKRLNFLKKRIHIESSEIMGQAYLIIKPSMASVLLKAASFYLEDEQSFSPAAEKILKMVFKSEPTESEKANAWYGLSIEYRKKDDLKLALKNIDAAINIMPDNSMFLFHRASLLFETDDLDNSVKTIEKLDKLKLKPEEISKKMIIKGRISEKRGMTSQALKEYQGALGNDPKMDDMANHRIASLYFNSGDLAAADENLEKIKNKKSVNYLFSKGLVLKAQAKYKEASLYFKNALDTAKDLIEEIEREYILCVSTYDPAKAEKYMQDNSKKLEKLEHYIPLKSLVLIRNNKKREGLDFLNINITARSMDTAPVYFMLAAYAYLEGDEPEKTITLLKRLDNERERDFLHASSLIKLSKFKKAADVLEKSSFNKESSMIYLRALALWGGSKKDQAVSLIEGAKLSETEKEDFLEKIKKFKNK